MPIASSRDLIKSLVQYRTLVLGLALAGALSSAAAAFLMTPKYEGALKLSIVETRSTNGTLSELAGQFGGLAALVGMNFAPTSTKQESLAYLRSKDLLRRFIEREQLLPVLFASKWDERAGKWQEGVQQSVTLNRGVRKLRDSIVRVQEDRRTGVVTLSVTWTDRHLAARWANELVALANESLRSQAVEQADRSIEYLSEQARKAQEVELRQSLYKVMESQISSSVLARARDEYAFKIIDPAQVPDASERASPKRLLMIMLGLIFGALVGLAVALARVAWSTEERTQ